MKIGKVHIVFIWLPFGQGLVINSKLCLVDYVKDPNKTKVHLDTTLEVILHELRHAKQIEILGLKFYWIILCEYIQYGHKNSPLEIDARDNSHWPEFETLRFDLMRWCSYEGLKFY